MDLTPIFQSAGAQYGVDPTILRALAMKESSMNPAAVNPDSGAKGLMQFTDATAKAYGIDPMDPQQAIPAAARMFSENLQRFNGSVPDAVAAHFAGPNQKLWGPKTQQYVGQVAGIFNQLKQGQPTMATPQPNTADPLLSMAQAIQSGKAPGPSGPQSSAPAASGDPLMAMAQQIQAGKMPVQAQPTQQASQNPAQMAQGGALASDLAAGGASPNTLSELEQVASGAAHGIGSMFNNAANFVERQAARAGILPQTAAQDTAHQAAIDQQFAQNASAGQKAAAIVAPMILPMSGAMAPGNAIRAGITSLPRMGGAVGNLLGAGVGNAVNGALMATGAPINPNQPVGQQDLQHLGAGAALGVALPAAFGATKGIASGIYDAARPVLNPRGYVGEQIANMAADANSAAEAARNAQTYIPGSTGTLAQVTNDPNIVALEQAQRANAKTGFAPAFLARQMQNNIARDAAGTAAVGGDLPNINDAIDRFNANQERLAQAGSASIPPGGAPTLGAAMPNLATPEFLPVLRRAQAMAQNEGSTAFADQQAALQGALKNRLLGITGEASDLQAAQAARAEQAADNFLSTNIGIPVTNTDYAALKQTPAFRAAFSEAQKRAQNDGIPSIETQVQNRSLANVGGAMGAPQTYVSGRGLAYAKSALDDQISAAARAGENGQVQNLMGVKNRLVGLMDDAIPGYAQARQAYGEASRPIDAMTTLQAKNLLDINGNVSPTKINSLIDSVTAAQNKPGFRSADSISPQQLSALQQLRDEALASKTNLNGLSGEGQEYVRRALMEKGTPEAQASFQQYLSGNPSYQQLFAQDADQGAPLRSAQALGEGLARIRGNTADEAAAPMFGVRNVAQLENLPVSGVQKAYVDALKKDVLRQNLSNQQIVPGSNTGFNISSQGWLAKQLYGPSFEGATGLGKGIAYLGAALSGHPIAGLGVIGLGNKAGQFVGDRLNAQVKDLLLNPEAALPYLDARAASPVNGSQQALAAALRRNVGPALIGGIARNSFVNSGH